MTLKPYAIALVLAACGHLPPTLIPVCSDDFEVVCRAPDMAGTFGRDMEWEKKHVCDRKEDLRCRACYIFRGALDGRQVYEYRSFRCQP